MMAARVEVRGHWGKETESQLSHMFVEATRVTDYRSKDKSPINGIVSMVGDQTCISSHKWRKERKKRAFHSVACQPCLR